MKKILSLLSIVVFLSISLQAQEPNARTFWRKPITINASQIKPKPTALGQTLISVPANADSSEFKWAFGTPPTTAGIESFFTSNDSTFAVTSQDDTLLVLVSAASDPGYTEYVALLTQTGTDAPVATVLSNTLGGTVVWSRQSAGTYRATLAGAFPSLKTVCFITPESDDISSAQIGRQSYGTDDYCQLKMDEGVGIYLSVHIRVYD